MYIDTVPNRDSAPCTLLRESYREGGKVKKRTIANLTDWSPHMVEGLRGLLKGGTVVERLEEAFEVVRTLPHGHVAAVLGTLRRGRAGWDHWKQRPARTGSQCGHDRCPAD
jgi:hypothetical protein